MPKHLEHVIAYCRQSVEGGLGPRETLARATADEIMSKEEKLATLKEMVAIILSGVRV